MKFAWHIIRDKTGKPIFGKLVVKPELVGRAGRGECEEHENGYDHHCFVMANSLRLALAASKQRHEVTNWGARCRVINHNKRAERERGAA